MPDPTVQIPGESTRAFANLQSATDYAVSRARNERPTYVQDGDGKMFLIMRCDGDFSIRLSREL